MSWKAFFSIVFSLVAVMLLLFYWVLPLGKIVEFGYLSTSGNTNFTLENGTSNQNMQFYENMRYLDKDISYRIDGCPLAKSDEMERAFDWVGGVTILNFHETDLDEDISITCDSSTRFEGRTFVAGEGGVTNVTQSGDFNVIYRGTILLLRETKCSNPIVGTHELLHALGFEHSANSENIMYPTVNCKQNISQDMIDYINQIYSVQNAPDLLFENASATVQGNYLSVSMTLRNHGLSESYPANLIIYANGKQIEDFEIETIPIGGGRIIELTNIFLLRSNIEEIELDIVSDSIELDKNNNQAVLKIKNI